MTIIKKGSKGPIVIILQHALHLYEDGIFGPLTEETVKQFQKEHGLTPDGIVGNATWRALGISEDTDIKFLKTKTNKRRIDEIIVHCSATREGQHVDVATIRKWHIRDRGWKDIGYHFVIYLDGSIHRGRNLDTVGAHCTGHNTHSIGVCYVGGVAKDGKTPKDTRTPEQKLALMRLLREFKKNYPNVKIYGHRDFSSKACPSFDAKNEYKNII